VPAVTVAVTPLRLLLLFVSTVVPVPVWLNAICPVITPLIVIVLVELKITVGVPPAALLMLFASVFPARFTTVSFAPLLIPISLFAPIDPAIVVVPICSVPPLKTVAPL
jgi:hypothetical protein